MPLLFNLGQHRALVAVQAKLREGERLFAFLDDVHVICAPTSRECPQDFAGGIVEAREDSSPPREDEDVESERHHTCKS